MRRGSKAVVVSGLIGALLGGGLLASPAYAANTDIGYPVFKGSDTPVPASTAKFTPGGYLQQVFDADKAAGAGTSVDKDFWMDRMLARTGSGPNVGDSDNNQWLFSRGRAAFMKTHNPNQIGFGGDVAYWESIDGRGGFTVTAKVDGQTLEFVEDQAARKQTPSYWRSVHRNDASGITITQTKFITDANVLVANLDVSSTGGATVELEAASPYATDGSGAELTGTVNALNNLTVIHPRFSGDGFTADGGVLRTSLQVPSGGSASTKVQLGLVTDEIPESTTDYEKIVGQAPGAAYTDHVTVYNEWWAENVPYLDTPEDNIDKTLYYRWWLMRFNFLDADMPGNTYQFPTAMEGVLGYNNGIVLTTGMFIDDLKYFRNPIYSYGPWVAAGETSKSYKFVDNPGDPANWSNSYTQYISEAAWRSYQLHGGPTAIAENLAGYAEDDVKGLVDAYDRNKNGLIEYNWGAMTGNDADAVSFHWKPNQDGGWMDRTENAYLYSNALASAEAYRAAGNTAKADEMDAFAANIKAQVLKVLWNPDRKLFEHSMATTGEHNPWKEINNYYPFSVGLVPKPGDADYKDDYDQALRLFADDKQYPIFPFYTANQADQAAYNATGGQGSNNFSVINSTVTFRMLSKVLRDYPTDAIDAEWYKKLLYWNAWSHYQGNGDNNYPDQNEFWANGDAAKQSIGYRSWIHHTILGATNFTVIEDAMGLRPRDDAKIELDPIDIKWDHFTADNVRYRDKDLTVTWDKPDGVKEYGDTVPEGYSVFLDGELAFTVDSLTRVVYDPATGAVELPDGGSAKVITKNTSSVQTPEAVRFDSASRVVDLFSKAGADIKSESTGSANLAQGGKVTASFSAPNRGPEGAVNGTTINEPFWGTAGTTNAKDSVVVELGGTKTFDDIRTYFYDTSSSATVAGYHEPSLYTLEVRNGSTWTPIPQQARTPVYPRANYNHAQFPEVTGDAVRLTATHAGGFATGLKEIQVFNTGVEAPASTNQAPSVEARVDKRASAPGRTALLGTVKDDGLPAGDLDLEWTVASAPEGATVIFDDPKSATTTARFSAEGEYKLRLSATDGEKENAVEITVQGELATRGANVAGSATPTAEFTSGWTSVGSVKDGKVVYTGGAGTDYWGTWDNGNHPATRWLQYEWAAPVRVDALAVDFWADGGGIQVPKAWKAQYWQNDAWVDVPTPSGYTVKGDSTNETTFGTVTTTKMRLVLSAAGNNPYAAVGVSEWQVFADAPTSIEPIDVRTTTGTLPELPGTVQATYEDNSTAQVPVTWQPVEQSQVAAEGSFKVTGLVEGSPVPASATVWVRTTPPGQINQVDTVSVSTKAGIAPSLPGTLGVLYNDGSRQDLPVTWNAVPAESYAAEGEFTVDGTIQSSIAGTKAAVATVKVTAGGDDTMKPTATLAVDPAAPASGWNTGAVRVTASATDDREGTPSLEVKVDGGAWAAYTAPVEVTTDGTHQVTARAKDAAGNLSDEATATVKIDTTAPAITPVPNVEARTLRVTAADAGSGVASIEYRIGDTAEWSVYTTSIKVGLEKTSVTLRSTDKAGNVSAEQVVEVAASEGPTRQNVALGATPTASYTSPWTNVRGLNDDVAPTKSGDVEPNDNANVWGAWPQVGEQWVRYDWAAPVSVSEVGVYFIDNLDAQGTGIQTPKSWKVQYLNAAGQWVDVTGAGEYKSDVDTFNTVAFDKVTTSALRLQLQAKGTVEQKGSLGIKEWQVFETKASEIPDTKAPVVTTTLDPARPASGWFTTDATVSASAIDDRDSAPKIEYTTGDTWAAYTGAVKVAQDGTTTVKFRSTDAAGNVSEPVTVEVKRDATIPTAAARFDAAGRTVTIDSADATSGVALVEYRVGQGAWAAYTAPFAAGDAAATVTARSTDNAGNVSAESSIEIPAKTTDPQPEPQPEPEPKGKLTGNEVLRLGVTRVAPGGTVPVILTGGAPGTVFQVQFRSDPVVLGTLTVGADGTAQGVFTIPAGATSGEHLVALVTGDGELTATVTVVAPGVSTPSTKPLASTGVDGPPAAVGIGAALMILLGGLAVAVVARKRRHGAV